MAGKLTVSYFILHPHDFGSERNFEYSITLLYCTNGLVFEADSLNILSFITKPHYGLSLQT